MPALLETMAYRYADRNDVPWHGQGARILRGEHVSAHEFMCRAGANWTISKRPVWYKPHPDVPAKQDERHFVLQRDDTFASLSIVGTQYKPVQNEQVFQFFHEFCEKGDMSLETGGILDGGKIVWALATLREGFTLAQGDAVTGHLLLSDSRDGGALRARFTPVRVVCANTLALALTGGSSKPEFRLNHRTAFNETNIKTALGLSHNYMEKFQEQAAFLASRPMSSLAFREFLEKLFPPKEVINKQGQAYNEYPRAFTYAAEALDGQKGANLNAGTWWQGFNAITYMLDHNKNRIKDNTNRLTNTWFGTGATLREKALETALAMAK